MLKGVRQPSLSRTLLIGSLALLLFWSVTTLAEDVIVLELNLNNWDDRVIASTQEAVRRFEELNPDIQVNVVRRKNWDEVAVRIIAGDPPDVAIQGLGIGVHGPAGLFIGLDDFITDELRAAVFEPMWSNFTWDGVQYLVPAMEHGPRLAMVWNAQYLAEAGLALNPYEALTWEEFFDYADKLTVIDGEGNVERMGYDPMNGQNIRLFTIAPTWGAADYLSPTEEPKLNHPNLVRMLDYTAERTAYQYPGYTWRTGWYTPGIATGEVAVSNLGVYAPGEIATRNPDMEILVTWVASLDGSKVQQVNGWGLGIPAGAKNPEASFRLIEFLATDVAFQLDLYNRTGFMGGGIEFFNELAATERDPNRRWYIESLFSADFIHAPYPDPFSGRADSLFRTAVQGVFNRTSSAAPLLEDAQRTLVAEMRQEGRF